MNTPLTANDGNDVEHMVDHASANAHEKIDRASAAVHPSVDRVAQGAHQAVDKLAGAATQASHQWDEKSEQMKDLQQKLTDDCRSYVREKPVASLAIAAAAGFLISRLLRSR